MADNIRNEIVTIHRSQQVMNVVLSTRRYFLQLIVSLKTQAQHSFLHLLHTRHQLSLDGFGNYVAVLALDFDTPVS
jgi:hypothetical protein